MMMRSLFGGDGPPRLPPAFEMNRLRYIGFGLLAGICIPVLVARGDDTPRTVDYVTEIKPLLARHCTSCHGTEKQKSGLRLDTGAAAAKGGDNGAAIEPGKSAESLLIQAITG